MYRVNIILILFLYVQASFAQKRVVDMEVIRNWEIVKSAGLSMDGKYCYSLSESGKIMNMRIGSLDQRWTMVIPNVKNPKFTHGNRYLIYERGEDSIEVFDLKKRVTTNNFKGYDLMSPVGLSCRFFAWKKFYDNRRNISKLDIWDSQKNELCTLDSVFSCLFFNGQDKLAVISKDSTQQFNLIQIDLNSNQIRQVWAGRSKPQNLALSAGNDKLAFVVRSDVKDKFSNVLYYTNDLLSKNTEFKQGKLGDSDFYISDSYVQFNKSGSRLMMTLAKKSDIYTKPTKSNLASVDIWNYKDIELQMTQLSKLSDGVPLRTYPAAYSFNDKVIRTFIKAQDERYDVACYGDIDRYCVIEKGLQKPDGLQVGAVGKPERSLILRDLISDQDLTIATTGFYTAIRISPDQKYVIYFDQRKRNFFCYEIATKRTINVTSQIDEPIYEVSAAGEVPYLAIPQGEMAAGWLMDDEKVYINGQHDIWEVDPKGIAVPVCLTKHYGRRNNLRLRFFSKIDRNREDQLASPLHNKETVLIHGVNLDSYMEGVGLFSLSGKNLSISLNPYRFSAPERATAYGQNFLIGRSSNNEPSNWFVTKDFSVFQRISDVQPQRNAKWYTKELMSYQMFDGKRNKLILYKPENFDSSKKYPVIFTFYEILSDRFYKFDAPDMTDGIINPAWMASRGYVVCQVDIPFKIGQPGESAYDAVVSAAKMLISKPWIDSTKMGLSGGSHGAFSINYILTKTSIFAAANSGYGVSDFISAYNQLRGVESSRQYTYESTQSNMGGTLWENKAAYLANSSVLNADKVTTPVLILHNKEDASVPWEQGIEWYLSLRRLGKKVWLLQYDGEGHGVNSRINRIDYSQRLEQFFEYYLKSKPAPKWMVDGIPAKMKMKDSGLELDTTGREP